ncbi:uncharacterized protein LOC134749499 [Cydia strobilella]|uniref:uncharacterized protein LOC134749499 n=1 Tax=Cydia strobilella TaxID=1100964 RepID=UPI003004FDDF
MTSTGIWHTLKCGGSCLKLIYAITFEKDNEQISKEHLIDNMVKIRFKRVAKIIEDTDAGEISFLFSISKHELAHDLNIKVNIDCECLAYSKFDIDTPKEWSEWELMGSKKTFVQSKGSQSRICYTTIQFFISAYERNINTMSLELYTDTEFTDFYLSTGEDKVAVHKAFLIAHSDVFKAMLRGKWKETDHDEIKIQGATVETLQQLKDYMYMGTVPEVGLRPLLLVARTYMMEDLEKHCIRKLAEKATSKDLFSLIEFACDNQIPELPFALLQLTPDTVVSEATKLKKAVLKKEVENTVDNQE